MQNTSDARVSQFIGVDKETEMLSDVFCTCLILQHSSEHDIPQIGKLHFPCSFLEQIKQ